MTLKDACYINQSRTTERPIWKDPIPNEENLIWKKLGNLYVFKKNEAHDEVLVGIPLKYNKKTFGLRCMALDKEDWESL